MVFELGTSQSLGLHGWRLGTLSRDDKLGIHPVESKSSIPRCASDPALEAFLRERRCVREKSVPKGGFIFTRVETRALDSTAFDFTRPLKPVRSKRHRHRLDVDGPNTAELSCKKRRLRADLITSRLSQPYSQPATHILNREGMESGDKRFLKMATTIDMARRIAHLHGTSFLRFSLMNRLRRKLGLWPDKDKDEAWQPQTLQDASGGKYLKPSDSAATDRQKGKIPAPRLSKPAALPLPSADLAATKNRTSPRIQPMGSPELRPTELRPIAHYEELEEDSFSFLHADDESAGDVPDDENVYSDFGVIFGSPTEGEDHTYEEYLDELDGISWMTR